MNSPLLKGHFMNMNMLQLEKDLNQLFFVIWRNKYLKNCIFNSNYICSSLSVTLAFFVKQYDYISKNKYNRVEIELIVTRDHFIKYINDYLKLSRDGLVSKMKFQNFNEPIPQQFFNNGLVSIDFGISFNQSIKYLFPNSVREIIFSGTFNKNISASIFPSLLKSLKFGLGYSKNIKGKLPNSVQVLDLGNSNYNDFPSNLLDLTISAKDKPLPTNLPSSVTRLHYRDLITVFDPNTIPPNIKELIIMKPSNNNFYHLRNNSFPMIESIDIDVYGVCLGKDSIPFGAQSVKLSRVFFSNDFTFPSSIKTLQLSGIKYSSNITIPNSVTDLDIKFPDLEQLLPLHFIPPSVIKLSITNTYIQPGLLTKTNVKQLVYNGQLVLAPNFFPSCLESLNIMNSPLDGRFKSTPFNVGLFPSSLTELEIPCSIDLKRDALSNLLQLKRLAIDVSDRTNPIDIPRSVTDLSVESSDVIHFDNLSIPRGLKKLRLNQSKNNSKLLFKPHYLPNTLTLIDFGYGISELPDHLPQSLIYLKNTPPIHKEFIHLFPNLFELHMTPVNYDLSTFKLNSLINSILIK
ncbi:hypothetical protein CYY_002557 [Polysphondylium violaceum]|uniref:FNIP repeat-containing protein n=1 Tax=Polysphondylium violaceum TaxID=133409 RepID=A0A8J4PYN8_9MYCE|nr:hypothetical protein CYY_002557 [Polysphondylium violaceum]